MIDFIGGLFGMVVGYAFTGFFIGWIGCMIFDHGKSYITDSYNRKRVTNKLQGAISDITEGIIFPVGMIGVLVLIGVLLGFFVTDFGESHDRHGHTFLDWVLFPYWIGSKISWVILPLGIWASVLVGGKAIYQITQKVNKLKNAIQDHIKDKGAHGDR